MQAHAEQLQLVEGTHTRRGYGQSSITPSHIAYHYFIGSDGTLVKNRTNDERTMHTRCGLDDESPEYDPDCKGPQFVNERSIAVVLAGDFEHEKPTPEQLATLTSLLDKLRSRFNLPRRAVMGHLEASPTACPGKYLQSFLVKYRGF